MRIDDSKTIIEPSFLHAPSNAACYWCDWLIRCWKRICDCFAAISLYFCPAARVEPLQKIIEPTTPDRGEELILAFCKQLYILPEERRSAEFYNVGQALFFSLNSYDKYILLRKLKARGFEALLPPYLQELPLEMQEEFNQGLVHNTKHLDLEKNQTVIQDFLQKLLFKLMIKNNTSDDSIDFEKQILVDQLQIIYFLYRIIYYSELRFTDKSDLLIRELISKLPETIRRDIASKATSSATKDLCLALIEHYIKPAAGSDPPIVKEMFFKLYEDIDNPGALENFARLSTEFQTPILNCIQGMLFINEQQITAYQLAAFKSLSLDKQYAILKNIKDEDLLEEYVDIAHPLIRQSVQSLWESSSNVSFGSIVKTGLAVLPIK